MRIRTTAAMAAVTLAAMGTGVAVTLAVEGDGQSDVTLQPGEQVTVIAATPTPDPTVEPTPTETPAPTPEPTPDPTPTPEPEPVVDVQPGESITTAANTLGDEGGIVRLHGGSYPKWTYSNNTTGEFVTVTSYPGEEAAIAGMDLANVQRVRVQDVKVTAPTTVFSGSKFVELLDNEYRARVQLQKSGTASTTDVTVCRNWFHDYSHDGSAGSLAGYGVIANTNTSDRHVICDNLIENLKGGDGIQYAATVRDSVISGNTIRNIQPAFGSHSDVVQIVAHNERLRITGNRFLNSGHPVRVAPSQSGAKVVDLVFENNLTDGIQNVAVQIKSAAGVTGVVLSNTFRNYDIEPNLQSTLVVERNVFDGPYSGGGDNFKGSATAAPAGYGFTEPS